VSSLVVPVSSLVAPVAAEDQPDGTLDGDPEPGAAVDRAGGGRLPLQPLPTGGVEPHHPLLPQPLPVGGAGWGSWVWGAEVGCS